MMDTMPSAEILNQPPVKKVSWFQKARAAWIRVQYGKTILPQCKQKSNLPLLDSQVLQRRDDPVQLRDEHAYEED